MEKIQLSKPSCLYFDDVTVDCQNFRLQKGEAVKTLTPRAFDVLLLLIQHRNRVVEKQEIFERVWKDAIVTDNALTRVIKEIRQATGDDAATPHYIETVPKRGYRFLAEVSEVSREAETEIVREHTKASLTVEQWTERIGTKAPVEHNLMEPKAAFEPAREQAYRMTRWQIAAACLLLLGLIAAGFYWWKTTRPKPTAPIKILAVLPFKPLATDNRDESLELGMAEALINRMSNIRQITVRPVSAVRKYMSLEQDPVEIGHEQKVEAVLDASMQRAGDKLRVSARLIRVDDGATLWADRFDEKFTDVLSVQDAIAARMTKVLAINLTPEEQKLIAKRDTHNVEAYQYYVKGRYFWNKRGKENLDRSIDYFQQALALDQNFALAYAGLADAYLLQSLQISPNDLRLAKITALKALELDEQLAEAHATLGVILDRIDYDWSGAEREFERAIELNPDYGTAHQWYAIYLEFMGQPEQAIAESNRAVAIDPLSHSFNLSLGTRLFNARLYDQAIEQAKKTLELDPNGRGAHLLLGSAYAQKRMYETSISEIEKEISLSGKEIGRLALLAYVRAMAGDLSGARKIRDELIALSKQGAASLMDLTLVSVGLGEINQAFRYLQRAYEERNGHFVEIISDPRFDSIRSDERFTAFLRLIGRG